MKRISILLFLFSLSFGLDYTFTEPERVDDDTTKAQQVSPVIAVDGKGIVHVAWTDLREYKAGTGEVKVYYAYRLKDGKWSKNEKVVNDIYYYSSRQDIVADQDGNVYCGWVGGSEGPIKDELDVYVSFRPFGGNWQPGERINDDKGEVRQCGLNLALDSKGNLYAVWWDARNGPYQIYFSMKPKGRNWIKNELVNPPDRTPSLPSMDVDSLGRCYVVWSDENSYNGFDVYFSMRDTNGAWLTPERINEESDTTAHGWPWIGVEPSGDAHCVWYWWSDWDNDEGDRAVYYSFRPNNGKWGKREKIEFFPAAITIDKEGTLYATCGEFFSFKPKNKEWSRKIRVVGDEFRVKRVDIAVDQDKNVYIVFEHWGEESDIDIYFTMGKLSKGIEERKTKNSLLELECQVLPKNVRFIFSKAIKGDLKIIDPLGRMVRRFNVDGKELSWDLKDKMGRIVSKGVYFVIVENMMESRRKIVEKVMIF